MRRIIIWILVAMFLLVGCRGGEEDVVATEPDTRLGIRFADLESRGSSYDRVIELFEAQNPEIRIEFVGIDEDVDEFELAELADVALLPTFPETPPYFKDLTARLSADDYWPGALAGCGVSGYQFGLPLFVTPPTVFVQEELLSEVGVSRPGLDWTWADFAEIVQAFDDHSAYGFVQTGGLETLFAPTFSAVLAGADGTVNTTALAEATDWYVALAQTGAIGQGVAVAEGAMWLDGVTNLSRQRAELGDSLAILPVPETTPMQTACVVMSTGTANEEEAWLWLEFLATNPPARRFDVPGRVATADTNGFWERLDQDVIDVYRYALDHAWYGSVSEAMLTVADTLDTAIADNTSSEEALADIGSLPTAEPLPTPDTLPVVVPPTPTREIEIPEGSIRFFTSSFSAHTSVINEAITEFTAQTGVPVTVSDFRDIFSEAAQRPDFERIPEEFDCFAWSSSRPDFFYGQTLPLDALLSEVQSDWADDFLPFTLELSEDEEGVFGLPTHFAVPVLYYNAERFERKDLSAPDVVWSLDDMMALAELMPLGEGRGQIYGFVPVNPFFAGNRYNAYALLLAGRGIQVLDVSSGSVVVNFATPETAEGVSWLTEQIASGVIAPYDGGGTRSELGNRNAMDDTVRTGRATMWFGTIGDNDSRFGWGEDTFAIGTATLPIPSDIPLPAPAITRLYISSHSENVQACAEWILFLSSWAKAYDGMPARVSAQESDAWLNSLRPGEAEVYEAMANRRYSAILADSTTYPIYAWWEDALAAVLGGEDVMEALTVAQNQADAYLACVAELDDLTEAIDECAPELAP